MTPTLCSIRWRLLQNKCPGKPFTIQAALDFTTFPHESIFDSQSSFAPSIWCFGIWEFPFCLEPLQFSISSFPPKCLDSGICQHPCTFAVPIPISVCFCRLVVCFCLFSCLFFTFLSIFCSFSSPPCFFHALFFVCFLFVRDQNLRGIIVPPFTFQLFFRKEAVSGLD